MADESTKSLGGSSEGGSGSIGGSGMPSWGIVAVVGGALAVLGWVAYVSWPSRDTTVGIIANAPTPAPALTVTQTPAQSGQPQVIGGAAPVIVEFTLNNTLQGANRQIFDAALNVLPPRDVPIAAPTPIGVLIQQQFAITPEIDPGLYRAIERRVRERSTMQGEATVAAGIAKIPQITPFIAGGNSLGAMIDVQTNEAASQKRPRLLSGVDAVSGPQRPATTTYLVGTTTGELRTDSWQTIINAPNNAAQFRYLAKPFAVSLTATASPAQTSASYTAPADAAWRQRLQTAGRDVPLFVLDTCWPDSDAWTESRRALHMLSQSIRKANGLLPGPSLVATGTFPAPRVGNTHCREVAESLKPLAGLSSRVKIIYVPMTRDQNSEDVLSEALWLLFATRHLAGNTQPAQSLIDDAVAFADASVQAALPTISDWPTGADFLASTALLEGLFKMADHAARSSTSPSRYFVNESWTTKDAAIWTSAVWPGEGFVVAAVGNTKGVDVNAAAIAFAGLAVSHKSGLAVMNMDQSGTTVCDSSHVTLVAGDAGAVGYAGDIAGACGSSFAAPRVSWILAAWESMRAVASSENYFAWRIRLRKLLEPTTPTGTPPQEKHFLFHPSRFFIQ